MKKHISKKNLVTLTIVAFVGITFLSFAFAYWSEIETAYDVYQYAQANPLSEDCKRDSAIELECDLKRLQLVVEEALVWRALAIQFHEQISEQKQKGLPLTSAQVSYLHEGTKNYIPLRDALLYFAYKNRGTVRWNMSEDEIKKAANEDPLFYMKTKVALASALVLYDNYLIGIHPYSSQGEFRRLINTDTSEFQNALEKTSRNFHSRFHSNRIGRRAIRIFEVAKKSENNETLDWQNFYLDQLITSSPAYDWLSSAERGSISLLAQNTNWFIEMLTDRIYQSEQFSMNKVSGVFGNAVGLVEFRKGKLFGKEDEEKKINEKLKPLDILLEKTPFRLTDSMIPGHWGHVAIWLGNEDELKDLGIWDDPIIKPHQESIRSGHRVLEALRPGVMINTLAHFMNVDDLAVLRAENLDLRLQKKFLLKAFAQIGKEYDFNFDVETDKKIVCSELVYVVFDEGFTWPTSKALGRSTISPDEVAKLSLPEGLLKPLVLYHDGIEAGGDLGQVMMQLLK